MSRRSDSIEILLARARQGDSSARDDLVDLLRPEVERHVRSLIRRFESFKVHCDPEDVIHSVWEDFLANYHKFETGDFELWFARRRRNRVFDQIRREIRAADNTETFSRSNPYPACSTDGENRVLARNLLEKIDLLPPGQKAVITLHHAKGWTFQEIGDLLEIRATSVGSLHSRALKKLGKLLRDRPGRGPKTLMREEDRK